VLCSKEALNLIHKTTVVILLIAAISLLVYPFWGLLEPESFRVELADHYAYDASATSTQIVNASYWLYFTNLPLSFALVFLAVYIRNSSHRWCAHAASVLIAFVPFAKVYASAEMGFILTSHTPGPTYVIEVSTEGLLYLLLALVIVAMSKLQRAA